MVIRPVLAGVSAGLLILAFLLPAGAWSQTREQGGPTAIESPNEQSQGYINPSLRHYLASLNRVFHHRPNLIYLASGAVASAIVGPFDDDISDALEQDDKGDWTGRVPSRLGGAYVQIGGPLLTFVAGRIAGNPGLSNTGIYLTEATATTLVVTLFMKHAIGRTRPNGENSRSFPSGHTSGTFAIASVLDRRYGFKAGVPAYAVASLIGLSRVRLKKHFPTDVLAGATLGIIIGRSFVPSGEAGGRMSFTPVVGPDYGEVRFLLSW